MPLFFFAFKNALFCHCYIISLDIMPKVVFDILGAILSFHIAIYHPISTNGLIGPCRFYLNVRS